MFVGQSSAAAAGASARLVPLARTHHIQQQQQQQRTLRWQTGARPRQWQHSRPCRARLHVQAKRSEDIRSAELLKVPGIGPRNRDLLHQKGLSTVEHLRERFNEKDINQEREKMVDFLRKDVGIVHCRYAGLIVDHLESMEPDGEAETASAITGPKKLTFCVEGNISVGKTTFLKKISDCIELQDIIQIVPEPIDKWQKVGNSDFNILDAFYSDPSRYAYTFQNYVFVTRLMQEQDSRGSDGRTGMQPLRLLERSVFSDRMVFVRAVHEARWMSDVEINIYDSWFDPIVSSLPGLVPDGFIYLRADPETCYKRLLQRARDEEISRVTLPYLEGIHEKHEAWLHPDTARSRHPLFPSSSAGQTISVQPPSFTSGVKPTEDIRDQVFHLGAAGHDVPGAIRSVPALVLDCNDDINVHLDTEAYSSFGQKIKNFHKYVQETQKQESQGAAQLFHPSSMPAPFGLDGNFSYEQLQKLQQDFGERLRF